MQQINLYQDQFKQKKKPLSAIHMLLVILVLVLGLTLFQFIHSRGLVPLQEQNQEMANQLQDLQGKITQMEQQVGAITTDKLLENEVRKLTLHLRHNQRLLQALTEGSMSNTKGFSDYFNAIANRHVDGTWLTDIEIGNAGHYLGFAGKSVVPALVPVYIQNLSDEAVFDNFSFNVLEMERLEEEPKLIKFNIATGKEQG